MFEKNYYTLRDLADELNIGESTIQYWQGQYHTWIPCRENEKEKWYPRQAIGILRFIMESADAGMSEGEIGEELTMRYPQGKDAHGRDTSARGQGQPAQTIHEDTVASVLKELMEGLSQHQMRIAQAQERRADAEERKAAAMERRAEAQRLMADALSDLSSVLQHITIPGLDHISRNVSKSNGNMVESDSGHPAGTVSRIAEPDTITPVSSETMISSVDEAAPENKETTGHSMLDDLAALLDDEEICGIETVDSDTDIPAVAGGQSNLDLLDDLSDLLDEPETASDEISDIDDLLKDSTEEVQTDMDDLTELLDDSGDLTEAAADNLDDLLQGSSEEIQTDLDDLTELIDDAEVAAAAGNDDVADLLQSASEDGAPDLDDLSELLEASEEEVTAEDDGAESEPSMLDDLSALVADEKEEPSSTIALSAEPDEPPVEPSEQTPPPVQKMPGEYKSKIIALIIQLKEKKGMDIDAVTDYMNQKGYQTLSGKGTWTTATITQIFEHIETVRSEAGA